jgi:plastocyanin
MRGAFIIVAAVLIAGCPGNQPEDSSQHSEPRNSTAAQNPQAVPEKSGVTPAQTELPGSRIGGVASPTVEVQLTEYGIQMPDTLQAGTVRLHIANAGKETHNFVIEGPGVQTKLSSDLMRGNTAEITATFQKGTYTIYCPIDGHRDKGMSKTVVVR